METSTTKMARTDLSKVPKPGINDRLSSLPDEIISHILSFLPTKYVVGTAVLSRRWKDLWTRVSNLDFDDRLVRRALVSSPDDDNLAMEEKRRGLEFCRFVDRVLSQHRNLDSVRRFRLHVKTNCKAMEDHLNKRKLYTSNNLKVLKLHNVMMGADGSVSLSSLKILLLQKVEVKNVESLSRLISGCPALESLHLENCSLLVEMNGKDMLIASLPYLSNLSILDWKHKFQCPIVIEAPNIEHLVLGEFVELQFLGSSPLPCLHSAVVNTYVGYDDRQIECLTRLLAQISNAKEMRLEGCTLEHRSDTRDIQLPVFPNLTHLTIELTEINSPILYSLLHSVPKLQSLDVEPMMYVSPIPMMWEGTEPTCTPLCLLSSLEEIKIGHFVPYKRDMKMVGYLLNAGAVLKKVDIHALDGIAKTKSKKLASLLNLPRKSSTCDVRLFFRDDDEVNTDNEDEYSLDEEDLDEDEDEGEDEYDEA